MPVSMVAMVGAEIDCCAVSLLCKHVATRVSVDGCELREEHRQLIIKRQCISTNSRHHAITPTSARVGCGLPGVYFGCETAAQHILDSRGGESYE